MKENEDLYVTNINGKLKLKGLLEKDSQHVIIHKRKLYFGSNNELWNMSLDNDNLEIKLKKEKKVVYLKRPRKNEKRVDPFGFKKLKPKQDDEETPREKITKARNINIKDTSIFSVPKRKEPPEIQNKPEKVDINVEKETEVVKEEEDKPLNVDMNSILTKVKHLLNEKKNYLIESDSKIEEDTVKYINMDIFIYPLNDKYIKLKTNDKDCVTFFKDSFIFTPCLNVDNQIFKLEKEDEIKNKKFKMSEEEESLSSVSDNFKKKDPENFKRKETSIFKKEVELQPKYKISTNEEYYDPNNFEEELAYLRNKNRLSLEKKQTDFHSSINFQPSVKISGLGEKKFESVERYPNYNTLLGNNNNNSLKENYNNLLSGNNNNSLKENYNNLLSGNNNNSLLGNNKLNSDFVSSKSANTLPSIEKKSKNNLPKETSLLDSDSSLSKIMTPDDFLSNIKKSVDIPDIDNLL